MLVTSSIIVNTRVLAPLLAKGHSSQLLEEDKHYIQVAEQKECLYSMGLRVLTFLYNHYKHLQTLTCSLFSLSTGTTSFSFSFRM